MNYLITNQHIKINILIMHLKYIHTNKDINPDNYTRQELINLILENVNEIKKLPDYILTKSFYNDLVNENGLLLYKVPVKFIDKEICINAISNNGNAIKDVPFIKFTFEEYLDLCILAIKKCKYSITFINNEFRTTLEFWKKIIESDISNISLLESEQWNKFDNLTIDNIINKILSENNVHYICYVSDKYKTFELCKKVLKINNRLLKYFPKDVIKQFGTKYILELLSTYINDYVIYDNGIVNDNFPFELFEKCDKETKVIFHEYLITLVKIDHNQFRYIPEIFLTYDIIESVIKNNGNMIENIPFGLMALDKMIYFIKIAMKTVKNAYKLVPEKILDKINIYIFEKYIHEHIIFEFGIAKVCNNFQKELFEFTDENKLEKIEEILERYVTLDTFCNIDFIPKKLRTFKVLRAAIKHDCDMLEKIPYDIFIKNNRIDQIIELIYVSMNCMKSAISLVPENVLDHIDRDILLDMFTSALEEDGLSLKHVPQKYMTTDLIKMALDQNAESFQFIPEDLKNEFKSYVNRIKNSETECQICMNNKKNCLLVPCGHTFCRKCVDYWQQTNKNSCPTCRIETDSIHKMFL